MLTRSSGQTSSLGAVCFKVNNNTISVDRRLISNYLYYLVGLVNVIYDATSTSLTGLD